MPPMTNVPTLLDSADLVPEKSSGFNFFIFNADGAFSSSLELFFTGVLIFSNYAVEFLFFGVSLNPSKSNSLSERSLKL